MADTRVVPNVPRRDDAFLRNDVRVCPLAGNSPAPRCWWVRGGHPSDLLGYPCECGPPPELWRRGRSEA
jgi:hypothetical protein